MVLVGGGGTLDLRMWELQVGEFSKHRRVIRYDIRGIGGSAPPDRPFSHSEDLAAIIEFFRAAPATIVGLSMAAGIALDLAVEHPAIVRQLVLAAPGIASDKDENLEDALALAEMARQHGLAVVVDQMVGHPSLMAAAPAETREFVRRIYLDNARVFDSNFDLVRLWTTADPPAIERLGSVRAPTLVLVGDRDSDSVRSTAEMLADRIGRATPSVISDAAHLLNLDAPAAFNETVLAFLGDAV
jgi:pimeloyl-ACP methyl ester carboxylesterase